MNRSTPALKKRMIPADLRKLRTSPTGKTSPFWIKFKTRFNLLEQAILNDKKDMTKLSEKELDEYYNEIKKS